jgi:hypothetical protein
MQNLSPGLSKPLVTTSRRLHNGKRSLSSTRVRVLTKSELQSLQQEMNESAALISKILAAK